MNIRLSSFIPNSLVNGPGFRDVVFSQGCSHKCVGCFNEHTHSFCDGYDIDINVVFENIYRHINILSGVTFSGGDPFCQAKEFSILAERLKKHDINIWCYTGYTYEEILRSDNPYFHKLLENIDVLIDGKFEIDKKDESLKYRGSSNQRVIDVKKSLQEGDIICELE